MCYYTDDDDEDMWLRKTEKKKILICEIIGEFNDSIYLIDG